MPRALLDGLDPGPDSFQLDGSPSGASASAKLLSLPRSADAFALAADSPPLLGLRGATPVSGSSRRYEVNLGMQTFASGAVHWAKPNPPPNPHPHSHPHAHPHPHPHPHPNPNTLTAPQVQWELGVENLGESPLRYRLYTMGTEQGAEWLNFSRTEVRGSPRPCPEP